jgi:drug/metabolite transporter (DMT)-like permease
MSQGVRTALLFALVCWIWGTTWFAIRLGLEGVPPFVGASIRMTASGVFLILVALVLRERWPRERIYFAHVAVQGCLLFGFQYALIYWAEQVVPSGLTAVLFAVVPIATAIVAAYGFKIEHLTLANIVGLVIGFCGVGIIYWSEVVNAAHASATGVAAVLLAAITAAFATVFAKRYAHGISPLATVGPGQLIGGITLGILALITEHADPIRFNATSIGALVYLTFVGSSVVFLAYFSLVRLMSVTRLSLSSYITPVIAVTLGVVAAHEQIARTTILGAAIVLVGVWLVQRRSSGEALQAAPAD